MLTQEEMVYVAGDLDKTQEELLHTIAALRMASEEERGYRENNANALRAMHEEFLKCQQEKEVLQAKVNDLKAALEATAAKDSLKTREIFGRTTEKLSDLICGSEAEESVDEAFEECYDETSARVLAFTPAKETERSRHISHGARPCTKTGKHSRRTDLDALPQRSTFEFDRDALDQKYGEGNWRIAHWHRHRTIERTRPVTYTLNTYTAVISYGTEHMIETQPYETLLPGSFASASIVSDIMYSRFVLYTPYYRLETASQDAGSLLTRQTMCNWVTRFALNFFGPIYDRLQELELMIPYHQCDETTMLLLQDGRKAGSKSYIWCHITSEQYSGSPICLYAFELTRGTDHLRKFYEDFKGFITCDAYCAYQTLEKEKAGVIIVCGCMMHLRRRFADSLILIDKKGMTPEMIADLPETKALAMIGKIYDTDEPLKTLSAEERKKKRQRYVKPLVEEFYSYIESLDAEDPKMSAKLKDAIRYSLNQKEHLCRFLEDGSIPMDNGACERAIRSVATARHNFLFCNSLDGANALSIMFTMAETARANEANPYLYFRYVLEEMPKHMEDTDRSFLNDMLPWSLQYRIYEKEHAGPAVFDEILGNTEQAVELPKTPRKKDRQNESQLNIA